MNIEDLRFSSSSIDEFLGSDRKRVASSGSGKIRIASLSDLSGFAQISSNTLVHISKQDFWRLAQDEEGNYIIERIVSDDEGPLRG